ncbi:MAG: hypothetical protein U5K99_04555 [Anaerolineales bacterium]|nr:hypothetical protein [Anaerolineales bacterium]
MENNQGKLIVLILFLVGVVIWMTIFSGRLTDLRRLTREYENAERTITALTATTSYLATEVVAAGSEESVEEWAYEERKWIRDGDQRLAISKAKGTPAAPVIQPTSTPEPENMFQVWWRLFFNTRP